MLKITTIDSQADLLQQSMHRRIIVCLDGTWETPQGNYTYINLCV